MVLDRTALSDDVLRMISLRFRSLGDLTRLKILRLLEGGELTVSGLVENLDTSQANVSKHLRNLVDSGILRRRTEGTSVFYSVADPLILKICDMVCSSLATSLKEPVEALGYRLVRKPEFRRSVKSHRGKAALHGAR